MWVGCGVWGVGCGVWGVGWGQAGLVGDGQGGTGAPSPNARSPPAHQRRGFLPSSLPTTPPAFHHPLPQALHTRHADTPDEWRFPHPAFKVVILYVDQARRGLLFYGFGKLWDGVGGGGRRGGAVRSAGLCVTCECHPTPPNPAPFRMSRCGARCNGPVWPPCTTPACWTRGRASCGSCARPTLTPISAAAGASTAV